MHPLYNISGNTLYNIATIVTIIIAIIILSKLKHSIIIPIIKLALILFILHRITPLLYQLGFLSDPNTITNVILVIYILKILALLVYGSKIIKKIRIKLFKFILTIILIIIILQQAAPLFIALGYMLEPSIQNGLPNFLIDLGTFIMHPFGESTFYNVIHAQNQVS